MLLEKISAGVLFIFVFSLVASLPCAADDEVGVYFNAAGTVNCLPDSDSFPESKDVYLILENCSSAGGVGGWEGAFSLPAGCYITSSNLGPESINVGSSPEYIVGFGTPLPQAPTMVLASFTFLFTAPGEVFLHAPEQNSVEGVFGPVYLEGGGTDLLVPMEYSFGSPFHAIASIGLSSCPLDSIYQEENTLEDPEWEMISPKESVFSDSGCGMPTKTNIPDDWASFFLTGV